MKQLLTLCLILVCFTSANAQSSSDPRIESLAPADRELLYKAIELVDAGMNEAAVTDFDVLAKRYPDNYVVLYERIFNLYRLGKHEEIAKSAKNLLKHQECTPLAIQLIGCNYETLGQQDKAIKTFENGLKKFPQSGRLFNELGNLYSHSKDYAKALEYYTKGIEVDPNFYGNYYVCADIYNAMEKTKVWSLIYAETTILLTDNENAWANMSTLITDTWNDNIRPGEKGFYRASLTPSHDMQVDTEKDMMLLSFPGIYEALLDNALTTITPVDSTFTCTFAEMIELRRKMIEKYYEVTGNLYGAGMYLFEYQKKVIDAGHWEAYNALIFTPSLTAEVSKWCEENQDKLESFYKWIGDNRFILGDGRSVSLELINSHYRKINFIEGIMIQGSLLYDEKGQETESVPALISK